MVRRPIAAIDGASPSAPILGHQDRRPQDNLDPDIALPSIEGNHGRGAVRVDDSNSTRHNRQPSLSITQMSSGGTGSSIGSSSSATGRVATPSTTISSLGRQIAGLGMFDNTEAGLTSMNLNLSGSGNGENSLLINSSPSASENLLGRRSTPSRFTDDLAELRLSSPAVQSEHLTPARALDPRFLSPSPESLGIGNGSGSARQRRSLSHHDPSPHNVVDEEPPPQRFHDIDFQQGLANAERLMKNLAQVLASSPLHTESESRINELYLQVVDLSVLKNAPARTVGLVGDSGVGKSSLLNSLLDIEGFARTSNGGGACTCVATEYHYHDEDVFALEVEYFSRNELREQFSDLLKSYRQYNLRDLQDDNMSLAERNSLKDKAKVAQDTLCSAFRNHLSLNENGLLPDLLESDERQVFQRLLRWTEQSSLPLGGQTNNLSRKEVFTDSSRCSSRLMELTSEPHSPEAASVWPFIQNIKIYMKAYILSKGLVFVDLPGLGDLNSGRILITENYLLRCHEIFAVCAIGRATTDDGVANVLELAKKAELSNVGIICTKSDDIQAEEAQNDWGGDRAAAIQRMIDAIEQEQRKLMHIYDTIEEENGSDSDMADGSDDGESNEELARLYRAARRSEKRISKQKFELQNYLITTRNQDVTAALREMYQRQTTRPNLPIFCVSNTMYRDHRKKPKTVALPLLELSGILEVRKHCLSIVAESQLRAATEYLTNAIPAILGSLELWVESGSGTVEAEKKRVVREQLEEIENALDVGAEDAATSWGCWHHATYSAFCRNYGDHVTAATVTRRCWNGEATRTMVSGMMQPWRNLQGHLESLQDELSNAIENAFDSAVNYPGSNESGRRSLTTLVATLRNRRALLLSTVAQLDENFQNGLHVIYAKAFTGIRSSYTGQFMEPAYNRANAEYGTGSHMRRRGIIESAFGDERLFRSVHSNLSAGFSELVDDLDTKLQEAMATHLNVVQRDLDTLKDENVALESESNPELRRSLDAAVRDARARLASIHADVLPATSTPVEMT